MRLKKFIPLFVVIGIIVIGAAGAFVFYTFNRETVDYAKVDNSANNISKEEAKNSSPIIINNILLGARYKSKWVSADKFFENSIKNPVKISTFIEGGKTGAYDVNAYKKNPDGKGEIYVETTYKNLMSEYIAVTGEAEEIMQRETERVTNFEVSIYENIVAKALNKFVLPNQTVKVRKVYNVELEDGVRGQIITATSAKDKEKGIYSTVIYVENGRAEVIKLNYIKDIKKSASWPIYDVKFVCDLNKDNKYEVVIEEVTEFDVKYSVMEKKFGGFSEVLSTKCEIKNKVEKVER